MSTKIYTGFKFADPDFIAIHHAMEDLKKHVAESARTLMVEFLRESVITELDNATSSATAIEPRLFGRHVVALRDRQNQIEKTQHRDPEADFSFELAIFVDGTDFYGMYFVEQGEWAEYIQAQSWYIEHAYWDNTDPPGNVSEDEWKDRGERWDRMVGWGSVGERAYVIKVKNHIIYTDNLLNRFMEKLPTLEERASKQARKDAANFYYKQNFIHREDDQRMHRAMQLLRESYQWCETPEGLAFIRRRHDDLSTVIKPITRELLID